MPSPKFATPGNRDRKLARHGDLAEQRFHRRRFRSDGGTEGRNVTADLPDNFAAGTDCRARSSRRGARPAISDSIKARVITAQRNIAPIRADSHERRHDDRFTVGRTSRRVAPVRSVDICGSSSVARIFFDRARISSIKPAALLAVTVLRQHVDARALGILAAATSPFHSSPASPRLSAAYCAWSASSGDSIASLIFFDIHQLALGETDACLRRKDAQRAFFDSLFRSAALRTAATTALIAASGFGGINNTSTPASIARTAASPPGNSLVSPCMSIASVTMRPANFRSCRSRPVMHIR